MQPREAVRVRADVVLKETYTLVPPDSAYGLRCKYEWLVELPLVAKAVRLSDYEYDTFLCRHDRHNKADDEEMRTLKGLKMDGQSVMAGEVIVKK